MQSEVIRDFGTSMTVRINGEPFYLSGLKSREIIVSKNGEFMGSFMKKSGKERPMLGSPRAATAVHTAATWWKLYR